MRYSYSIDQEISLSCIKNQKLFFQILKRLQYTYTVLKFSYEIEDDYVILQNDPFDETLRQYKQQYRLITVYEAELLMQKYIQAAKGVAINDVFFGGYSLDDFCLIYHDDTYIIKVLVNLHKIVDFVNGNLDKEQYSAPEINHGIFTEKADFWSFASCFMELVHIQRSQQKGEFSQLIQSLDIQDIRLVNLLEAMTSLDHKKRISYKQFSKDLHEGNQEISCIKTKLIGQTKMFPSLDALLKQCKLSNVKELGEGSFGKVLLVQNQEGLLFAAKFIKVNNQKQMNKASSEMIAMFKNLSCKYVIDIVYAQKVFIKFDCYVLVQQEFASFGDMRNFINKYRFQLTKQHKMKLFYDISCALVQIKQSGIVHRDLKPDNILITSDYTAKLADFGCNQIVVDNFQTKDFGGTYGYLAPEVLTGGKITFAIDVWSFGVMLQQYCEDEQQLIDQCFIENPDDRISIECIQSYLESFKDVSFDLKIQIESNDSFQVEDEEEFLSSIAEQQFTFSSFVLETTDDGY